MGVMTDLTEDKRRKTDGQTDQASKEQIKFKHTLGLRTSVYKHESLKCIDDQTGLNFKFSILNYPTP